MTLLGVLLVWTGCTKDQIRTSVVPVCTANTLSALDKLPCPPGTKSSGAPPPKGTMRWCERPDGTKDGPLIEWYPNGKEKSEVFYRNGQMHGPSTAWHDNGHKLSIGCWKNGKADGVWTYFDEQGEGLGQEVYKEGVRLE
jgi:hypothetical protein